MEELLVMLYELIYSSLSLVWSVLPIIGMWLVFEKAGERGWKAIVPFYNMYILFKIGERKKYWPLYLIGGLVCFVSVLLIIAYVWWVLLAIILAFGAVDAGWTEIQTLLPVVGIAGLIAVAGYVVMLIAIIHGYSGICKKMGQDAGMVVGLLFLGPIFWMLLGAGKQYQWVQPAVPETSEPVYNSVEYQTQEWQEPYIPPEE